MKEAVGDIWESGAEAICVTTNGVVKANGELVMGRGIAKEAVDKYPGLAKHLGVWVRNQGNIPAMYDVSESLYLISLPTKNDWRDPSDLGLIRKSLEWVVALVNLYKESITLVALPRPGCGNGGLRWEDVRPLCEKYLDDRFVVYSK